MFIFSVSTVQLLEMQLLCICQFDRTEDMRCSSFLLLYKTRKSKN